MRIICPHCKGTAKIRTSRAVSELTKDLYCQCQNVMCGHTFVAHVSAVRTISPSATPDPLVELQIGKRQGDSRPKPKPGLPGPNR